MHVCVLNTALRVVERDRCAEEVSGVLELVPAARAVGGGVRELAHSARRVARGLIKC